MIHAAHQNLIEPAQGVLSCRTRTVLFSVAGGLLLSLAVVYAGSAVSPKLSLVFAAVLAAVSALPILAYLPGSLERLLLLLLSVTLTVSLKFHLMFRAESMSGAVGYRISITDLLLFALSVAVLWRHWGETRRPPKVDRPIAIAFGLYFCTAVLSTVLGADPQLGFFELSALLQAFFLFVVLINYLNRPDRLKVFVTGLLIGLCLQSGAAILQAKRPGAVNFSFLGIENTEEVIQDGQVDLPDVDRGTTIIAGDVTQRPVGLLIHPNVLALYLGLVLPAAAALLLVPSNWVTRSFAAIGLLGGLAALYYSLSRSGWLATAVAAVLLAAIWRKWRLPKLTVAAKLALILTLAAVACGIAWNARKLYDRMTESASEAVEFRLNLARAAFKMAGDHPLFGIGLNDFLNNVVAYDTSGMTRLKAYPVHNVYLLELSETGAAGAAAFAFLVGTLIWRMFRYSKRAANPQYRAVSAALACGAAGFFVAEMSGFVYRIPVMTTFIWSCAALALALGSVSQQQASVSDQEPQDVPRLRDWEAL